MRNLEFKAYNHDTGKWNVPNQRNIKDGRLHSANFTKQTIVQYTGIKDKNGKKIFEGDVVRDTSVDDVWTIYWDIEATGWGSARKYGKYYMCGSLGHVMEIIGNVFDTPQLAGEKSDNL